MPKKPSYEEMEKRVLELEQIESKSKRSETALWVSEEKYRTILESIDEAYFEVDLKGNFTFFNDSLSIILGYSRDELMGKNNRDYMPPRSSKEILNLFGQIFKTGKPVRKHAYEVIKKDGTKGFHELAASLMQDKDGNPIGFRGIAHDVTERKRAEDALQQAHDELEHRVAMRTEELALVNQKLRLDIAERKQATKALRENENLLRAIVEGTQALLANVDANGYFTYANDATARAVGYAKSEELIGKSYLHFIHPEDRQQVRETFINQVNTRRPSIMQEFRITDKEGNVKWFSFLSTLTIKDGQFVGQSGVAQDITEHKQAETALAIANKQWEATFDAISDWVSIIDKNHNIIRSNNASKSLVDLSPKNVVGKHCQEIVHGRGCPIPDCPMELAVNSKQRESMEIQLENGRWVQISVDPIINKNKDELFVHIVRDITDRKRVEVEKDKLKAQKRLIQKAESLTRMAGAIAHNFNNQLQVVIGNLEIAMVDQPRDSENLSEALKAARKAADISALMLTYSGKQPGKYEPIDLSAAYRQSLTLLQAAVPKGTTLKADLPASGPVIRCNAGQIQQVIINLVTNAWESADESRRGIGLTVKTVSQKDIPAFKRFPAGWNPQESVYACLEVVDAGCGIACKDIEKIFDPFFTTKFTGRGLGLSAVLGIVTAHNGGITLESQPGRGSVFRVFLPISAEEVPSRTDKVAQPPEIQEGGTVLLVEDEEMVRKMARTMLTHLEYGVLEAKDGAEALEIFKQHQDKIRCVLSDLTMPHMNGWDTLISLRQLSPDIPVILSSGYDETHVMAVDHPERPNAFLGKPYRLQELKDTLRQTLADKKKRNTI